MGNLCLTPRPITPGSESPPTVRITASCLMYRSCNNLLSLQSMCKPFIISNILTQFTRVERFLEINKADIHFIPTFQTSLTQCPYYSNCISCSTTFSEPKLIYVPTNFSKAFDKVPYERLFNKLKSHGISGNVLNWIKKWLSNRRQRVCIEGEFSEWAEVTSGVPHGSVLGPILFIIYIDDLDSNVISKLDKFADDSKLGKSLSNQDDVECLRKDLISMEKWSSEWQMQFNTDKCAVMHLGRKNTAK